MSLAFGILGFLNYKPMSGYDLVKAFESSLEFFGMPKVAIFI